MKKTVRPVVVPAGEPVAGTGTLHNLKRLAEQASTFQKLAVAVIAGITLTVLLVTTVNRYAPWAWASDVIATNAKVDFLSTIVLQSQIEDTENRIAQLEVKARTKGGLTSVEAEYLRAKKNRLAELRRQLESLEKGR